MSLKLSTMALLNSKPGYFSRNRCFNRSKLQYPFIHSPPNLRFAFRTRVYVRKITLRSICCRLQTSAYTNKEEGEGGADLTSSTEPVGTPVRIVAVVGEGSISPFKCKSWFDVMVHTAERMKWVDEAFKMLVFSDEQLQSAKNADNLCHELNSADVLLFVAITNQKSVDWIKKNSENVPNIICFESTHALVNRLGGSTIIMKPEGNVLSKVTALSQPKHKSESEEVFKTVSEAWNRYNSDDIRFCLLVIINAYIKPVSVLKNLRATGFSSLNCMIKNCAPQVLNCLLDPNCRKALKCLNNCSPVDQVCTYRCIASYESSKLEEFSLCVLQKNNCLGLDAKIPNRPFVPPIVRFRGHNLIYETAEDLFVGWLGNLDWSWRVVSGQNPAYDQFPCQYQLFYRGKSRGSFWYEPVFQVKTLDGNLVWRRRKYRVKRGKIPGTFFFSVLDNGVVSNEFWTIVDVADDFSWGLFHYHGAARVAGQSYTGAVLVSPDGSYPNEDPQRLSSAFDRCGLKEWELFSVDNFSCQNAPLGLPEGSSLHSRIRVEERVEPSV